MSNSKLMSIHLIDSQEIVKTSSISFLEQHFRLGEFPADDSPSVRIRNVKILPSISVMFDSNNSEKADTLTIRISENPLTAQNFMISVSALTTLHTKCWLISEGRFNDLIKYTQTRNPRFVEEAGLVITMIRHNSPVEAEFIDPHSKGILGAIASLFERIGLMPTKVKEQMVKNKAAEVDTKLKEL